MKLRNFDWENEEDFQEAFRPRKQHKIKKMKKSSKNKSDEGTSKLTDIDN